MNIGLIAHDNKKKLTTKMDDAEKIKIFVGKSLFTRI